MTQRFYPWRTITSEDAVSATPWLDPDSTEQIPELLESWYIGKGFSAVSTITLDPADVAEDTGFEPDDLLVTVEWECSTTKYRGAMTPVAVADCEAELLLDLPADKLGGVLTLRTLLLAPADSPVQFSPKASCSPLWEQRDRYTLEGDAPQFSVTHRRFADTAWAQDAAFVVDIEPATGGDHFERPYSEVLRLVFNSDHPLAANITGLPADDLEAKMLMAWAKAELAGDILHLASDIDNWSPGLTERFTPAPANAGRVPHVHTLEELCYVTAVQVLGNAHLELVRQLVREPDRLLAACQTFARVGYSR
jgi:hypothetical protein